MYTSRMSRQKSDRRNVIILAIAQALFMSGTSLTVATSALVGWALASNKDLASLPFTMQLLATMLTSIPAALLMARIGRKRAFLGSTLIAAAGGVICTLAIVQQQFMLFIAGSILIGMFSGFANYYRFAAADAATSEFKSRAISYVLAGGVIAALIGPNLANHTRELIASASFAGSYAALIVIYILSFALLSFLKLPQHLTDDATGQPPARRRLAEILRQPRFIIAVTCGMLGYAIMSLIMTATPLAMKHHAYPFADTAFVIQWHVLGMFAPSFFTGHLIKRLGVLSILFSGALLGLLCVWINFQGTTTWHFWTALLLLGISWNFLFIGATTLLTETYHDHERFKVQAINDFLVFSVVAFASLSAGYLHHRFGWQTVNLASLPAFGLILLSLLWLLSINQKSRKAVTL